MMSEGITTEDRHSLGTEEHESVPGHIGSHSFSVYPHHHSSVSAEFISCVDVAGSATPTFIRAWCGAGAGQGLIPTSASQKITTNIERVRYRSWFSETTETCKLVLWFRIAMACGPSKSHSSVSTTHALHCGGVVGPIIDCTHTQIKLRVSFDDIRAFAVKLRFSSSRKWFFDQTAAMPRGGGMTPTVMSSRRSACLSTWSSRATRTLQSPQIPDKSRFPDVRCLSCCT